MASDRSPAERTGVGTAARAVTDIRTGRFERSLAGLAAAGALITAAEIFTEHDGASFGNKMMWWPVVIIPSMAPAGVAAVFSRRAAKTVLPLASAVVVANGMQGTYLHWRGIMQKPGGRTTSSTTSRWVRRCSPPCWRRWSVAWGSWPRCCAAKASGERAPVVRQAAQGDPVTPGNKGRFGDFDVLGEVGRWDLVTAGVVLARLDTDPQLSFFDATRGADGPCPARPVAGPAR